MNYIKRFLVKKTLNYGWGNLKTNVVNNRIKTVGILADDEKKELHEELLEAIFTHQIKVEKSSFLVFKSDKTNCFAENVTYFSPSDFGWSGGINEKLIIDFCDIEFDLLINFFNEPNPFLIKVAQRSKAEFKVGFDTVDQRLNYLLIQSADTEPTVFVDELFKYLKILNKI
ncbi:DUF6913 domain-containing protein [Flavobacterium sp. GNP001]